MPDKRIDPLFHSPESLRRTAAILRAGVPKRKDVWRWAGELDAQADELERASDGK